MKKLATLMLGLSLLKGTESETFARQDTKKENTKKTNRNKNKSKDTAKDKTGK